MPARLPDHLIEAPAEYLKDMPVGATWFVGFVSLRVDAEHNCFLDPMAERREPGTYNKIKVRRDVDGYHVIFQEQDLKYRPGILPTGGMLPVTSITEAYSK